MHQKSLAIGWEDASGYADKSGDLLFDYDATISGIRLDAEIITVSTECLLHLYYSMCI